VCTNDGPYASCSDASTGCIVARGCIAAHFRNAERWGRQLVDANCEKISIQPPEWSVGVLSPYVDTAASMPPSWRNGFTIPISPIPQEVYSSGSRWSRFSRMSTMETGAAWLTAPGSDTKDIALTQGKDPDYTRSYDLPLHTLYTGAIPAAADASKGRLRESVATRAVRDNHPADLNTIEDERNSSVEEGHRSGGLETALLLSRKVPLSVSILSDFNRAPRMIPSRTPSTTSSRCSPR
jgi:hypothetical protein